MAYCKHGEKGNCCCNCKNQIRLFKHPKNTGIFKGLTTEESGYYSCRLPILACNKVIVYSSGHGACELYTSQDKKT